MEWSITFTNLIGCLFAPGVEHYITQPSTCGIGSWVGTWIWMLTHVYENGLPNSWFWYHVKETKCLSKNTISGFAHYPIFDVFFYTYVGPVTWPKDLYEQCQSVTYLVVVTLTLGPTFRSLSRLIKSFVCRVGLTASGIIRVEWLKKFHVAPTNLRLRRWFILYIKLKYVRRIFLFSTVKTD